MVDSETIKQRVTVDNAIEKITHKNYDRADYDKLFVSKTQTDNLLSQFPVIYKNLKILFDGKVAINGPDAKNVSKSTTLFTKLSLCNGKYICDFFKSQFDEYTVDYPSNHSLFKDQVWENVPDAVINPPELSTEKFEFNATLKTIQLKENKISDCFLPNYKVTFDKASDVGKVIDIEKITKLFTPDTKSEFDAVVDSGIRHGLAKMFETQYCPRGHTPFQMLMVSLFSYRCPSCTVVNDEDCFCYLKSYSLKSVMQLIEYSKGIPFKYDSTFARVHRTTNYSSIGSQIPSLFVVLLELSTRTGCGVLDPAFEAICVKQWLKYSINSLYGGMLGPVKKLNSILDMARNNSIIEILEWDKRECSINGKRTRNCTSDFSRSEFKKLIIEKECDSYFNYNFKTMDDAEARYIDGAFRTLTTLPKVIPASVPLSMYFSVLGTSSGNTIDFDTKYDVELSDTLKVSFGYVSTGNRDVDDIYKTAVELITLGAPRLDNLEEKFVEKSTNKSSGTSESESKYKVEELIRSGLPKEEAEELASLTHKRLFDVVYAVKYYMTNPQTFLSHMTKFRSAGVRSQVGRRLRIIQMVPTVHMATGFLVYTILDAGIRYSGESALGKSIGDVRDTLSVLRATYLECLVSSTDVVGMDTATLLTQRRFMIYACFEYLQTLESTTFPYFMNKNEIGITQPVSLYVTNKQTGKKRFVDFSVVQFILLCALAEVDSETSIKDGYFTKFIKLSQFSFDSGSFQTSSQHTFMLTCIMRVAIKRLQELLNNKYPHVKFTCQGDDLLTYVIDCLSRVNDVISNDFIVIVENLFNVMGFKIERELHRGIGEFLKLVAVYGKTIPLHARINLFSSETGEDFRTGTILSRLRNIQSQLQGLSARVPKPQHTTVIGYYSSIVMGYANYYIDKVKSLDARKIFSIEGEQKRMSVARMEQNLLMTVKRDPEQFSVIDTEKSTNIKYILPGVWYTAPVVGFPGLPYINKYGELIPAANYTSFPSPAQCRYMFSLIYNDEYNYIDEMAKITSNVKDKPSFLAYADSVETRAKQMLLSQYKRFGENIGAMLGFLFASPKSVPVPLMSKISIQKAVEFGFIQIYAYTDAIIAKLVQPESSKSITSFLKFADSLLDPGRVLTSALAADTLRKTLPRSTIPDELLYKFRNSTRMNSTINERHVTDSIHLNVLLAILNSTNISPSNKFFTHLAFGDYELHSTPLIVSQGMPRFRVFDTGIGFGVPAESPQAYMVNTLGLPPMDISTATAIRERLGRELLLLGSENAVLNLVAQATKRFGKRGSKLASEAVGVSEGAIKDIQNYIANYGTAIFSMPYALSSDHIYYFNTVPDYIDKYRYQIHQTCRIKRQTQLIILVSEWLNNPNLLLDCQMLLPGNILINNLQ